MMPQVNGEQLRTYKWNASATVQYQSEGPVMRHMQWNSSTQFAFPVHAQ